MYAIITSLVSKKNFEVVYSIKARFAGSGIGTTSYNAVKGIFQADRLKRLICSSFAPNEIDPALIKTVPVDFFNRIRGVRKIFPYWLQDYLYDLIASVLVEKADIFHVWNLHGLLSLRKAKKQGSIVVVERASSHILEQKELLEEEYRRFNLSSQPIHPFALKRALSEFAEADFITVPSFFAYHSFIRRGFKKEKLIWLNFGVDLKKFRPARNIDKRFRALFVGEVGLRKGVIYLLQAWKKLGLKEAELVLVGGESSESQKIFQEYKDDESIKFLGFTNPLPWYQNSSVFVFPSIEEGSALVCSEALACGLPVITTPNSGTVVEDKKSGYLVPIRDSKAMAERIEYLYKHRQALERMSKEAEKRAQLFSWEAYGKNLVLAYERILH